MLQFCFENILLQKIYFTNSVIYLSYFLLCGSNGNRPEHNVVSLTCEQFPYEVRHSEDWSRYILSHEIPPILRGVRCEREVLSPPPGGGGGCGKAYGGTRARICKRLKEDGNEKLGGTGRRQ
jgi:hypothetical protein